MAKTVVLIRTNNLYKRAIYRWPTFYDSAMADWPNIRIATKLLLAKMIVTVQDIGHAKGVVALGMSPRRQISLARRRAIFAATE